MNNECHDSDGSTELEEEVEEQTSVVKTSGRARKQPERFSPPDFHLDFALSSTKEDPIMVKESINSSEGKL